MGITINPNNSKIGGLPTALGLTEAGIEKVTKTIDKCMNNTDPMQSSSQVLLSVSCNKSWKPIEKIYFAYLYGIIVDQNLPYFGQEDGGNRIMNGLEGWNLIDALALLQSLVIALIANNPVQSQIEKESLLMAYSDYLASIAGDPNHNFGRP